MELLPFEQKNDKLLSPKAFYHRLMKHLSLAGGLVLTSLGIGALGFHFLEGLGWLDSFYNACMNLTGNGPVVELKRNSTKIFASLYSIYGGVVVLAITAIVLSPVAHRLLHLFHLSENDD